VPVSWKAVASVFYAAGVISIVFILLDPKVNVNMCCADCIRLLAGRGMNICHEVWSLSTVMQPHTVYNKHIDLLQYFTGNLRKIQHVVLTLSTGLLF